jgi:hypothetical protein
MGTCKVRNEIETKRNEAKPNETKWNQTKQNETDRNETKENQTKRNETKLIFTNTKCNEKKIWKIQYDMKTKRVYNILIIQI